MASRADRSRFLAANTVRFRIAEWCAAEPISKETIAERLGRASGSLSAPKTLLKHGALVEAGYATPVGGGPPAQLFRLSSGWKTALDEARRLLRPVHFEAGTELLLVPLAGTEQACAALATEEVADIAWGARLGGEQIGLILSPHRDLDGRAGLRAVAALERVGVRPVRLKLQSPMPAEELKRWSLRVTDSYKREIRPAGR